MKIQPVNSIGDCDTLKEPLRADTAKPVFKSRLRRLFDRQFPSVLKNNNSSSNNSLVVEKLIAAETQQQQQSHAVDGGEFEPSSLCLAKMVQNFIEENNDKQQMSSAKCGRNRCNCFNGNSNDSSDDEFDSTVADSISSSNPIEIGDFLKSLITCGSVAERNLLADVSRIVDKNKQMKRKDDLRIVVADGLTAAGHDALICKSRWEKKPTYPAGEYEYIDVIVGNGERVIIDIDFRSEFEIARSTGSYKAVLQLVPFIFVGKADRLQQIVSIVCEAARQSLRKEGLHFPPWRKAEYMRLKWLAPHTRAKAPASIAVEQQLELNENENHDEDVDEEKQFEIEISDESEGGQLELIFNVEEEEVRKADEAPAIDSGEVEVRAPVDDLGEVEVKAPAWHPPPVKPRSCERSGKAVVPGLAFLLRDSKP